MRSIKCTSRINVQYASFNQSVIANSQQSSSIYHRSSTFVCNLAPNNTSAARRSSILILSLALCCCLRGARTTPFPSSKVLPPGESTANCISHLLCIVHCISILVLCVEGICIPQIRPEERRREHEPIAYACPKIEAGVRPHNFGTAGLGCSSSTV